MKRKISREDILSSGLSLMFINGYNATGIKDITENINIPKGSFYNHFTNKESFGLEVVKMYCDNGIEMYKKAFLNQISPPLIRVENFFTRLIEIYSNELEFKLGCIMGNFSAEMSDTNEKFRILLDDEFNKCQEIIEKCLQEAIDNNELKKESNPNELAAYILNAWHGAMLRMKSTGDSKPLKDCKNMVMNYLLI